MAQSKLEIHSFCNGCQRSTRHTTLSAKSRERREGNEEFPRVILEAWKLLQCLGCQSIKAHVTETSMDFLIPREIHYPAIQYRSLPKWVHQLPETFRELIQEVYLALYAECPCLSTMGTRALVDTMLTDLIGDCGGFAVKLSEAVKSGILTDTQKQTIQTAVEAGHAVSHRGYRPTSQQVHDVLDIVEHALMGKYILESVSTRLSTSVPPREKGDR